MKKLKRLLSVLLAVCLLLSGIPMTALAVEPEPEGPSFTGLFLHGLVYNQAEEAWDLVPTDAPEFFDAGEVILPGEAALGLNDPWFVAAYCRNEDGTVDGPFRCEALSITGNATVTPLKDREGETVVGGDPDGQMLCITPTAAAEAGDTFTLQWGGPNNPSAQYGIELPHAAFYSDNARDKAHLLNYDLCHADGENTEFYLILDPSEASLASNVAIVENADKASLTEVSAGVYKITVPAPTQEPYGFNVKVQWTMADPNDPNNTRTDERNMWMHPAPYTGLVIRELRYDEEYPVTDEQGNPVTDEEGNPVKGAWFMPEIDQNDPLAMTSQFAEAVFGEQRLITVHYFDGETLSPPLDVNNLTFTGNVNLSPLKGQEPIYGDNSDNYLFLSPTPNTQAGDQFTISWTKPESNPAETYSVSGVTKMPVADFYRENVISLENYINPMQGGFEYSATRNTFYFLTNFVSENPNLTVTVDNVRWNRPRKADIVKEGENVWKITLKEPFEPYDFDMTVTADVHQSYHDPNDPSRDWEETGTIERNIWCHPQRAAGQMIGSIVLGGTPYAVRRTESGKIIYSTHAEGSPFETEAELPQGVSFDPDTYTLTLNNATLNGEVRFDASEFNDGQPVEPFPTFTINVEGESTINGRNGPGGLEVNGANLVIRGPGVLNINTMATALVGPDDAPDSEKTLSAPGIRLAGWNRENYTAGLTIQGNVTVNVNTDIDYPNSKNCDRFAPCVTGMFEEGVINLTITGNAKVNLNANGDDMGVRGLTNITVEGQARLTADVITEFDSLTIGSADDTAGAHAVLTMNGAVERPWDWTPTLNGRRIEIKGYGEITVNEDEEDHNYVPSINLDKSMLGQTDRDGLYINNNGKLTVNNAHFLYVETRLEVARDAVLDINDNKMLGLQLGQGATAVINGTVTIDSIDNEQENWCVWMNKGSAMTLGSTSRFITNATGSSGMRNTNCGFMNEGTLTINGGAHSFKATGNQESYGFISQRNGVTNVNGGTIDVEGTGRAMFTNSSLKHNYFTLAGDMHIVSKDAADNGTELGFVDGILEGSSPTEYEFYLYQGNNASGGTPVFVQKAQISSASGTAPKAERASVTLQTVSTPSAGAWANFTASIDAPLNTEALVTVELPSGLSIVADSITKDTLPVSGTTIQKLPVMGPTIVRFSTDTTAAGTFPVTVKVYKNESDTKPIAEAACTLNVHGFDISAPTTITNFDDEIWITGTAAPGATVTLKRAEETTARATADVNSLGSFRIKTNLQSIGFIQNQESQVAFDVYLTPDGGTETKQEKQITIEYKPQFPELKPSNINLTIKNMVHDNAGNPKKSVTTFPMHGRTRVSFPFLPSETTIDFSVNVNLVGFWPLEQVYLNLFFADGSYDTIRMKYSKISEEWVPESVRSQGTGTWTPIISYQVPKDENGSPKLFTSASVSLHFVFIRVIRHDDGSEEEIEEEEQYETPKTSLRLLIDPSGIVYEGNEDCPLEGVTAELYYLENEPGNKDATDVGEKFEGLEEGNPITTDMLGQFAWMVPEGWWQVRFTKDGYESAHTQWMKVQPERTGLKVSMTASTPAELVNSIERSEDGKYFTITFTKPVKNDTVTTDTVVVSAEGKVVEGTFSPANGDGATATEFHFVPDEKLSPYAISIQAKSGIETYNSAAVAEMAEPYKESGKADGPTTPVGPGGDTPSGNEPVTNPDGSVTVTETAEDGTVTATTTWEDGKKSVETTSSTGDKTIVVTDGKGGKMADISIPADPGAGKKFKDVSSTDWYAGDVDQVTAYGLFDGTSKTTFSPNKPMTRAMLMKVLHNLSSESTYGTNKNVFTDVKSGDWFAKSVMWGYAMTVTTGTSATTFAPNKDLTREQMVAMLHRFAKIIGADSDKKASLSAFPDNGKVSGYAKADMEWAVAAGLIRGRSNGSLDPGGKATRAEVAAILVRFVDYLKH